MKYFKVILSDVLQVFGALWLFVQITSFFAIEDVGNQNKRLLVGILYCGCRYQYTQAHP